MSLKNYFLLGSLLVLGGIVLSELLPKEKSAGVLIFAAASTGPALEEFQRVIKNQLFFAVNSAASSVIARQIINGSACDFVLLADSKWMDELAAHHKIVDSTRRIIFSNNLVLVSKAHKNLAWDATQNFAENVHKMCGSSLALAEPHSVPAGRYAKQALTYFEAFDALATKMLFAADVRQALLWVEQGRAQCAVVYDSDALSSKKVQTIFTFPQTSHSPINYEFATCSSSVNEENRLKFTSLFFGPGRTVFAQKGFRPL